MNKHVSFSSVQATSSADMACISFSKAVLGLWKQLQGLMEQHQPDNAMETNFIENFAEVAPNLHLSLLFLVAPLYWRRFGRQNSRHAATPKSGL
jgi:hypothetical protein